MQNFKSRILQLSTCTDRINDGGQLLTVGLFESPDGNTIRGRACILCGYHRGGRYAGVWRRLWFVKRRVTALACRFSWGGRGSNVCFEPEGILNAAGGSLALVAEPPNAQLVINLNKSGLAPGTVCHPPVAG